MRVVAPAPWRLCVAVLLLLLGACAANQAPVEDRSGSKVGSSAGNSKSSSRVYSVQSGDTLYAIAWRFGYDFKKLANANGISSPYTIFPGQRIQLREADAPARKTSSSSSSKPPSGSQSKTTNKPAPRPAPLPQHDGKWRWPSNGAVVRKFSGDVHKGIDIAGEAGDAVVAVAAGRVVYAGNGIVGYGNLLIVKHDETYLSAYGHNRRLLVSEGSQVKAGQRIAEKGSSATNSVKLHFEIRREGKPIDPLKLLPRRS